MNQDQNSPESEEMPISPEQSNHDAQTNSSVSESANANNEKNLTASKDDSKHQQTEQPAVPPKNPKKSAAIKISVCIVLILLLGLIAFGLWKSYQPKEVELQGRVEAETIHVSTKVPSRIEEMYAWWSKSG